MTSENASSVSGAPKAVRSTKRYPFVKNHTADVVYLFQFPRLKCFPNLSPFCLKLECWLRFSEVNYKVVENLPVMHRSTEGTLPYIEVNGQEFNDSAFIIRDLPDELEFPSLESHLTSEQKATSLAFERLVENSLFMTSAKFRYENMDKIIPMLPRTYGIMQPVFNMFIKRTLPAKINEKLMAVGVNRHSDNEIIKLVFEDLRALSILLADKPYMMGDKPTKLDASAFAAIALIVYMPFYTPQKQQIEMSLPSLKAYADRIKEKYWPDWDQFGTASTSE